MGWGTYLEWTVKDLGSVIEMALQDDLYFFLFQILQSEEDEPEVSPVAAHGVSTCSATDKTVKGVTALSDAVGKATTKSIDKGQKLKTIFKAGAAG